MANLVPCKKCRLPMKWVNIAGRFHGQNPDGTSHWDRCSQERTARVKREGEPFKDSEGEGFIFEGKKHYMHKVAETHFGKPVQRKGTA